MIVLWLDIDSTQLLEEPYVHSPKVGKRTSNSSSFVLIDSKTLCMQLNCVFSHRHFSCVLLLLCNSKIYLKHDVFVAQSYFFLICMKAKHNRPSVRNLNVENKKGSQGRYFTRPVQFCVIIYIHALSCSDMYNMITCTAPFVYLLQAFKTVLYSVFTLSLIESVSLSKQS